jgi:methylated-DNA-[protein]-cysteine S-methyltransferase
VRVTRHRYAVGGWGVGEVWVAENLLVAHELPGSVGACDEDASLADMSETRAGPATPMGGASSPEFTLARDPSRGSHGFVPDLCQRVERHLAGEPTGYANLELDLTWCTDYQQALLETLRAVPWGEVVTYGELAALAGRPGAARAAGSFCAGNRFALVVPCHRVVAADGIGGYGSSGVGLKRRLLALEGVTI